MIEWRKAFATPPELLTAEEIAEWKAKMTDFVVSSDAFFPFPDNIDRVASSGVSIVAAPKGSVMDDVVVETCKAKGVTLIFTHYRLFHH